MWKFLPFMLLITISACTGTRPTDIGIQEGGLKPCPDSPNCVSSFAETEEHKIEPLPIINNKAETLEKLKSIINSMPRTEVIQETDNYLYVEFTTFIMRYVDDVEFYIPDDESVVHVRSASRLGHSDMGLNRERIEAIRSQMK
ncbi:DUF1499 domain-containing protein [Pseudobacteriovorax antillogorgiicola]|uniref:Uncharacterized conserved protein, DUF1499 family n=1 Tax=Pseudobacteriovorax antillogorgiicola TaxID=1513793 RepID=A0A1Y6CIV1_9BACT|nr:DUF1499 domain-containing protein [Pseudobacteriovorax antillogorgiicola]TCS48320.1 uncharacterized protein (DUF1499 family) [Pseudobacteriovorax antillogorgiicola]SMF56609.1 Uncharacterized conserved protein, DUF1499 family [Pseudobacteriovorax antillogorgiicola]